MAVRETTWTNLHCVSLILHSRGQYVSLIVTNRKWTASQENCFSNIISAAVVEWRFVKNWSLSPETRPL